ncbi:hypothetical protein BGX26_011192, partial [Mortierella sp. AD094]
MFEHEMLFTPAIQRPIYAARNDDVHLRLRVKMTILDQSKKTQHGERSGDDSQRKKMKSNGDGNSSSINGGLGGEDTDMTYSAQEIETKAQHQLLEGGVGGAAAEGGTSSIALGLSNGDSTHVSKTVVTRQYQLCQYGHPEPGRTIVVRSAILVKIHGDAFGFLSLLGYG